MTMLFMASVHVFSSGLRSSPVLTWFASRRSVCPMGTECLPKQIAPMNTAMKTAEKTTSIVRFAFLLMFSFLAAPSSPGGEPGRQVENQPFL